MIIFFFGKRKRFSNQSRNALAECAVESFDMTGLPRFLSNGPVSVCRYNFLIRFPKIRIADRALTVNTRKRFPQFFRILPSPAPDIKSNYHTGISVKSEPYPSFYFLFADKTPHFIWFKCQPAFTGIQYTEIIWDFISNTTKKQKQPSERDIHNPADTSQGYSFGKEFFNNLFLKSRNRFFLATAYKLPAAVFAEVILFTGMNVSIFFYVFRIAVRAVHK